MRHRETSIGRVSRATIGIVGTSLLFAAIVVGLKVLVVVLVVWGVVAIVRAISANVDPVPPVELTRDDLRSDAERAAWDRAYAAARSQAAISDRR